MGAVIATGPDRPVTGDSAQYLSIAKTLANGDGYGYEPDIPTYDRMPGWPLMIAAALRLAPTASPEVVLRFLGVLCLAAAGALFVLLSAELGLRSPLSVFSGLALSLSPPMMVLCLDGLSEISFVLVLLLACWVWTRGGIWQYGAALLCGVAMLIRTNLVLLPVIIVTLCLLQARTRTQLLLNRLRLVIVIILAYVPPLGWAARNYAIVHRFPFLSSIEGETLYGGNNERVATDLQYWGYWIQPDLIPGEPRKADLMRTMDQLSINDYYHRRAVNWIHNNLASLPRLYLGKLTRAFVPMPWVPSVASYFAFSYRLLLDVLFVALAPWWWGKVDRRYLVFLTAMFLVNLATVLVYWGVYRFTHVFVEIFLIPPILIGSAYRAPLLSKYVSCTRDAEAGRYAS
jgi:hypothetical protein